MKKNICPYLIGILIGISGYFIVQKFVQNVFNYNDLDLIVKFLGCLGTIFAGLFVWWKWIDEKNRIWYEKRLREVYVPLLDVIIRQETYRGLFYKSMTKDKVPIFYIKNTKYKSSFGTDGIPTVVTEKNDGIISLNNIKDTINNIDKSLAEPKLAVIINKYKLFIDLDEEFYSSTEYKHYESIKLSILSTKEEIQEEEERLRESPIGVRHSNIKKEKLKIEKELVDEIIKGYNKSIKKLGFSDELINLDEI